MIKTTHLTTKSASQSQYDAAQTDDKVFLLSYADALKPAYGFKASDEAKDTARKAKGTAYAKCQGLQVSAANDGNSYWRLRTPDDSSSSVKGAVPDGTVLYGYTVSDTTHGIRPVCKFSVLKNDTTQQLSYTLKWVSDNVTTTAKVPVGNPISVYKPADPVKAG